jgi:DNA-binding transcriptional ArsR family regulator
MVKCSPELLNETFGALADPTRRRMMEMLAEQECRVTELAEPFAMSLPAVSKHLRVLENAGLLKRRRLGREHRLKLNPAPIHEAMRWIGQYRKFWEDSLDNLAAYLEASHQPKPKKKPRKKK